MPGFCVVVCVVVCLFSVALAAWVSVRRGAGVRAVLVVSPNVPPGKLEGVLRAALRDMLGQYAGVAVFAVADGERAAIIRRVCAGLCVDVLERGAALRLWRLGGAEFWRVGAGGVPTLIPRERKP